MTTIIDCQSWIDDNLDQLVKEYNEADCLYSCHCGEYVDKEYGICPACSRLGATVKVDVTIETALSNSDFTAFVQEAWDDASDAYRTKIECTYE